MHENAVHIWRMTCSCHSFDSPELCRSEAGYGCCQPPTSSISGLLADSGVAWLASVVIRCLIPELRTHRYSTLMFQDVRCRYTTRVLHGYGHADNLGSALARTVIPSPMTKAIFQSLPGHMYLHCLPCRSIVVTFDAIQVSPIMMPITG